MEATYARGAKRSPLITVQVVTNAKGTFVNTYTDGVATSSIPVEPSMTIWKALILVGSTHVLEGS